MIIGTGFGQNAIVTFGGMAATNVIVHDSNHISCVTPAGVAGLVDVIVTNRDGQAGTLTDGYTYVPTIWTNGNVTYAGTSYTITQPIGIGSGQPIHLFQQDLSPGPGYTALLLAPVAPTVTAVYRDEGVLVGGTSVRIDGSGFISGATVTFDGTSAVGVQVYAHNAIFCITPAHAAGAVSVVVANPDAQTGTLLSGYTYINPEFVLNSITPIVGTTAGGTTVTVSGANFIGTPVVTIGNVYATSVTVVNAQTLTFVTPVHSTGAVDIRIEPS